MYRQHCGEDQEYDGCKRKLAFHPDGPLGGRLEEIWENYTRRELRLNPPEEDGNTVLRAMTSPYASRTSIFLLRGPGGMFRSPVEEEDRVRQGNRANGNNPEWLDSAP